MSLIDRYGNSIDNPPHNDLIVGSDGVPLPGRSIIRLGSGLTATDQAASGSTLIDAVGSGTSPIAANSVLGNNTGSTAVPIALSATAAGLALLGGASAAAQRTSLGLVDLSDMNTAEVAHANSVCSFANPSYGAHLDFLNLPGALGSPWQFNAGTSGAASLSVAGLGNPGVLITTGALSTNCSLVTSTATVDGPSWGGDLVLAANKWHVRWYFRLATTPSANTIMGMGWVSTDASTIGPIVGVSGTEGHFAFMKLGAATITRSTVAVDTTNNHKVDMWTNGTAGTVFFSFDNETPIAVTGCTFGKPPCPFMVFQCTDTGAAQQAIFRRSYYRIDGDVAA